MASLREKLDWVKQPLSRTAHRLRRRKIAVHVAGQKMEAISGQILFDFDAAELGGVKSFPGAQALSQPHARIRGVVSEGARTRGDRRAGGSRPSRPTRRCWNSIPSAAGALVNLGTIYYRQRKFGEAEKYYRDAIEADPAYPLAQFNLGNLYDEQGRARKPSNITGARCT